MPGYLVIARLEVLDVLLHRPKILFIKKDTC
jgi:hypothetical protein